MGEAANLVLSLILVRSWGLTGVAIGTLAPLIVGHLGVMLPAACGAVGMSVMRCVDGTTRPAAIAAAVAACACAAIRVAYPPLSGSVVIAEATVVGGVYVASLVSFGFDVATRATYVAQVRGALTAVLSAFVAARGEHGTRTDGRLSTNLTVPR